MDKDIGVGLLVGLLATSTVYIYKTSSLNKAQKIVLYICIVFPPAQWLLLIIFSVINHFIEQNSKEVKEEKIDRKKSEDLDSNLQTLKDLYEQEILTKEEYEQKSAKIKTEQKQTTLKQTVEYKKLKDLQDDGILTKEEFESKISKIKLKANKTINKKPSKKNINNYHQRKKNEKANEKALILVAILASIFMIIVILISVLQ